MMMNMILVVRIIKMKLEIERFTEINRNEAQLNISKKKTRIKRRRKTRTVIEKKKIRKG